MGVVNEARNFALRLHSGETYGGIPYSHHLREVSSYLHRKNFGNELVQAAAYLHDSIQHKLTTKEELQSRFGSVIAELVHSMTGGSTRNCRQRTLLCYRKALRVGVNGVALLLSEYYTKMSGIGITHSEAQAYVTGYKFLRGAVYPYTPADKRLSEMWSDLETTVQRKRTYQLG